MKPIWIGAAVAGVLGLGALIAFNPWVHFGPVVSTCAEDNEIDSSTRGAVDAEAMKFLGTLTGPNSSAAYAELSAAGRAAVPRDRFGNAARQVTAEATTGPPAVSRTFLVQGVYPAKVLTAVLCGINHGSAETVAAEEAPTEAHVLLTQLIGNAERTFDVWLVTEDGRWKVNGFTVHLSRIAGWDGKALWEQAKQQRAREHMFNAAELYGAASETLNGGWYYQSPDWNDFQKDFGTFTQPPEFQGNWPRKWVLGGRTYPINGVTFMGIGKGQVLLLLVQPSQVWNGDADADRRNRQTLEAFIAAFPEWPETFEAVSVRSMKPDNSTGWGTVYERGKGYVGKKPEGDHISS